MELLNISLSELFLSFLVPIFLFISTWGRLVSFLSSFYCFYCTKPTRKQGEFYQKNPFTMIRRKSTTMLESFWVGSQTKYEEIWICSSHQTNSHMHSRCIMELGWIPTANAENYLKIVFFFLADFMLLIGLQRLIRMFCYMR